MASEATQRPLIEHFSALKDPRQIWKVVYPLPEIMLLVLCATLAGAEDFVEARLWGVKNLDFLRRFLPFKDGLPSHDTLNDVINALDPALFKTCFVAWVEDLRDAEPDIVAIDGKTSRRTYNRRKGREPLHLVSAWAARQRLVLGQEATDAKSNEITAIPLLLERLALTGALVTLDAMGCQTKIAQAIQAKGADYLIAVKDNWPNLHGEIERFFAVPSNDDLDRHATTDGDHGRIEIRRHVVSHDVAWLSTDRRVKTVYYPGLEQHPDHAIAAKQMRGFGGMVCVDVGGGYDGAARFFDRLKVFRRAASLGGVESLCSLPVLTSQWGHTEEELERAGVTHSMARLSVGLEDAGDLIADLDQALG